MCVVAIAWRAHENHQLVVAGNRDELHARASAPLHRWDDGSGLIGGKDLVSGGMWMGVSEGLGVFGVVTNRRSDRAMDPEARSRGLLLADVLSGAPLFAEIENLAAYNPVNLGLVDGSRAEVATNEPSLRRRAAAGPSGLVGVFGLSNGDIDQPSPRVDALTGRLAAWLNGSGDEETLFEALRDETPTADEPSEAPFGAQPLFMRHPIYGTRCSTVIVVDNDGRGRAVERSFDAEGRVIGEVTLAFRWS